MTDYAPETIIEGLKHGAVAQEVPTLPPRQAEPQPQSILSPLGQQRYTMMQEVNQTMLTLVTQRVCHEGDFSQMRRLANELARQVADELEG